MAVEINTVPQNARRPNQVKEQTKSIKNRSKERLFLNHYLNKYLAHRVRRGTMLGVLFPEMPRCRAVHVDMFGVCGGRKTANACDAQIPNIFGNGRGMLLLRGGASNISTTCSVKKVKEPFFDVWSTERTSCRMVQVDVVLGAFAVAS